MGRPTTEAASTIAADTEFATLWAAVDAVAAAARNPARSGAVR